MIVCTFHRKESKQPLFLREDYVIKICGNMSAKVLFLQHLIGSTTKPRDINLGPEYRMLKQERMLTQPFQQNIHCRQKYRRLPFCVIINKSIMELTVR